MEIEVADGLVKNIEAGYGGQKTGYYCIADEENADDLPPPGAHAILKNFAKGKINVQM